MKCSFNEGLKGRAWIGLCMYDAGRSPAAWLLRLLRAHPHILLDGEAVENVYYVGSGPLELEACIRRLREWKQMKARAAMAERECRRLEALLEECARASGTDSR
jgi:hypothetical protein